MKNFENKAALAFYGLFGAFLGLLIFMFALGGWEFVFTGHHQRPWNGGVALAICLVICGGWGLLAYKLRDQEFGSGHSNLHDSEASAILFTKRLMTVASCLAALYFMWQVARGI